MDANGILVVAKPRGLTSHDVVCRVRRALGTRRVGHAGTLDPDATGVLILLLGRATGAMQFMVGLPKAYRVEAVLGVTTDTGDASGKVLAVARDASVTRDRFLQVLERFRGEIMQVPPMVSAVHHQGRRLYELARSGMEVRREPRPVRVYALEVETWPEGPPHAPLVAWSRVVMNVRCSSGTYVRQLVSDIGDALGCGAHAGMLERTSVGEFDLTSAHTLDEIEDLARKGLAHGLVLPVARGLAHLPAVTVTAQDAVRMSHGQSARMSPGELGDAASVAERGGLVRIHAASGDLVCVARAEVGEAEPRRVELRPVRVFAGDSPAR